MNDPNMPHLAKVMLCTMLSLESLREQGLIDAGPTPLTSAGKAIAEELLASGFTPTEEEMRAALKIITNNPAPQRLAQPMKVKGATV